MPAANEYISGASTPVAVLSGGINSVSTALYVGNIGGESGTYLLQGGTLSAPTEYVGNNGSGSVTQSGGVNSVSTELDLGYNAAGGGSYNLSAGSLAVSGNLNVGDLGNGTFVQSGGSVSVTGSLNGLTVGLGNGSGGSYNLSGGSLSAPYEYISEGVSSTGTFTQSGGTHSITEALVLGGLAYASGSYNLSGGSLSVPYEYVGSSGSGSLAQLGGHHTVSTELDLGYNAAGSGSYSLTAGADGPRKLERGQLRQRHFHPEWGHLPGKQYP